MRLLWLLVLLSVPVCVQAQDVFIFPDNLREHIVAHLEAMKIKDPSRQLSARERHDLCRLFVKAYVLSIRKHRQDYLLSTRVPVYRLLVTNFPELKAREGEMGTVIFLGTIAGFFNASPEYRPDVLQVLRAGLSSKYCKQP